MDHIDKEHTLTVLQNAKKTEILRLIDDTLFILNVKLEDASNGNASDNVTNMYRTALKNIKTFRESMNDDKIPRPSQTEGLRGAGLGLTRSFGEWCDDDEVLSSVTKLEDYYRYSY
ncbi:MAG: hypothetical protein ACRYG8_23835 [Janthinobacterium lividum]